MSYAEFDAIKISIASPEKILDWSYGEVTKPETINYRTLKPEKDGLFCERIFGPTKDWECHCGRYKKSSQKGKICERCGVEVTQSKVRRERMGHITMAAPVSHIWYFKGIPSRMGLLLDISPKSLEKVLYFANYIVIYPGEGTDLVRGQILSEKEYLDAKEKWYFDEGDFEVGMGAEAVKALLATVGMTNEEVAQKEALMKRRTNLLKEQMKKDLKGGTLSKAEEQELEEVNEAIDAMPCNLERLSSELREDLKKASGQKKAKLVKRLEVVDAFRLSGNKPEWMVIDVLPVIPPELRPMVQLDGGRFATSDLNDLYRRVINRNNRLRRLIGMDAPDIIVRNEKRMLQEAVDALIDNGRRGRAVTGANNRELKSLSDMLKGKQGRFRQNLLGKRVDYSGRSVIVVGPELKIYQCGVPKEMAIELFRPFVMKKLVEDGHANNIKSAKKMVDKGVPAVWDALEFVIKDHPVMLNRAPTLHRLGIQAFEPVLVEGRALKLHPLVCTPFNADFDGDQMAIHVPLSAEAQTEARILMLSANNLLRPQDGSPVTVPTQDMVLGSYYLTYTKDAPNDPEFTYETADAAAEAVESGVIPAEQMVWVRKEVPETGHEFIRTYGYLCQEAAAAGTEPVQVYSMYASRDEALMAYDTRCLSNDRQEIILHDPIRVRLERDVDGRHYEGIVTTTIGRLIYNEGIPQDLGFVKRDPNDPVSMVEPEVNQICGKKLLGKIIDACISHHDFKIAAGMLDTIKARGYHYSTIGSLTVSIYDMTIPAEKKDLIHEAEEQVIKIDRKFKRGFLTEDERYRLTVDQWSKTTDKVSDALTACMDRYNPIFMMADSGARGSQAQIRQLAGMRGLMANTAGKTIEIPVKANFREGLTVLEYFISSRGARKGMADTALRTADSGYLTRRLVDVSQQVIIREDDCGTREGINISEFSVKGQVIETFAERLKGRYLTDPLVDPDTGEILLDTETMLLPADEERIKSRKWVQHCVDGDLTYEPGVTTDQELTVKVRSVLDCRARQGVCSKCYGMNLANGERVGLGEAVGIIAAQSIGEPGTQLTMRTFHSGGVAGDDITQGLPRVEELFEARKPKKMAKLAEIGGKISITESTKRGSLVDVTITAEDGTTHTDSLPHSTLVVKVGQTVEKGEVLTSGSLSPHDVLRLRGISAVHNYLIQEVLRVYKQQGVDLNDKHIEVICREMMRKVEVDDAGDSDLLPGSTIELTEFEDACQAIHARIDAGEVNAETGEPLAVPTGHRLLMGITKASLATESWLSAASFQETTKVLTEAAIKSKEDHLLGLKENVIIGKLIPAGSGLTIYRQPDVPELEERKKKPAEETEEEEDEGLIKDEDEADTDATESAEAADTGESGEDSTSAALMDALMGALARDVGDDADMDSEDTDDDEDKDFEEGPSDEELQAIEDDE
ncbi:MAG: DNA-directed RNA polymerase subunit beta' [Oscillospiraceae bacterium]|nr:DNA-directed RNA polymerase subunit beta' [Oscillospiraceae bacterium]